MDENALLLLMINSLSFPERHGFGKLNTLERITKDVPGTFELILNNTSVIATMFYENIAFDFFNKRPVIEYKFIPSFNIKKSKNRLVELLENGETIAAICRDEVESGELYSNAYLKFTGGDRWLYLIFGYNYQLIKKEKSLKCYLFSEIYGKDVEHEYVDKEISLKLNEEATYEKILQLIYKVLKITLNKEDSNLLKQQEKDMRKLFKSISKKI